MGDLKLVETAGKNGQKAGKSGIMPAWSTSKVFVLKIVLMMTASMVPWCHTGPRPGPEPDDLAQKGFCLGE